MSKSTTNGFVYFLINPSMPGLVKIGWTSKNVEDRMKQLNGTGVPTPFQIMAQIYVSSPQLVERQIHNLLKNHRVDNQREFFSGDLGTLFEKCIPAILKNITNFKGESTVFNTKNTISSLAEQILLHMTTGTFRDKAKHDLEYINESRINWLIVEWHLEELHQHKLVKFTSARGKYDWDSWRITSKGIKYLFDAKLLIEDELDESWSTWA